jgi:hypothetical protein
VPFQSQAQRRYLWANRPDVAERWSEKYGTPANLPKRKKNPHLMGAKKR